MLKWPMSMMQVRLFREDVVIIRWTASTTQFLRPHQELQRQLVIISKIQYRWAYFPSLLTSFVFAFVDCPVEGKRTSQGGWQSISLFFMLSALSCLTSASIAGKCAGLWKMRTGLILRIKRLGKISNFLTFIPELHPSHTHQLDGLFLYL